MLLILQCQLFSLSYYNNYRYPTCLISHLCPSDPSAPHFLFNQVWNSISANPNSTSQVVHEVFSQSSALIYSSLGYNAIYGYRHKVYSHQDSLCADFIRDVRVAPDLKLYLLNDII